MKRYVLIVATLTLLLGFPTGVFAQDSSANAGTEKEVRDALENIARR